MTWRGGFATWPTTYLRPTPGWSFLWHLHGVLHLTGAWCFLASQGIYSQWCNMRD